MVDTTIDIDIYCDEDAEKIKKISLPQIDRKIKVDGRTYTTKRDPANVIRLECSDMRFSIGGEHYYGKFTASSCWFAYKERGRKNEILSSWPSPDYVFQEDEKGIDFEIKKKITTKEAKYLNKKNSFYGDTYKRGDYVNMFDTPEELMIAAKDYYDRFFDESVKVELQSYSDANKEFEKLFKKYFKNHIAKKES